MAMESCNPHFEAPAQDFDFVFEQDQEEDALSLCDLPLHEHIKEQSPASVPEPEEDFFEFPVDPVYGHYPMDMVVFGKSIPSSKPSNKKLGSNLSFKLGHCPSSQSPGSHAMQQHKSLKSKSSNSHKHLIGLVKYHQQEMDLNEIRKRQGKRAPVAMFPVNGGEKPEEKVQSSVMRPLRCRSHLLSALAKVALGCIPHV